MIQTTSRNQSSKRRVTEITRSISIRVFSGIGLVLILVTFMIGLIFLRLNNVGSLIAQIEDLRVPTAQTSTAARANMLTMLINIRGYLALGDPQFITNYQDARRDFEQNLNDLETLSSDWTNSENVTRLEEIQATFAVWEPLPQMMFDLHDDPLRNQVTLRILEQDMEPHYNEVLTQITHLIDNQAARTPSEDNTSLLLAMADFRGSWGPAFATLTNAVVTLDSAQRAEFDTFISTNGTALSRIQAVENLLTQQQRDALAILVAERAEYMDWVETFFNELSSDQTRQDLHILNTQAVPNANRILDILASMNLDQEGLLSNDVADSNAALDNSRQDSVFGGLIVLVTGLLVAVIVIRNMVGHLNRTMGEIANTEARMSAIVNHTADGIIIIDEEGIIQTINPAIGQIFGFSNEDVIGQNIKMLMPEPYHSEHDEYIDAYLDTGIKKIIGINRDVQGQRKDGSVFPLELSVSEVELEGRRFFSGILRDITERQEALNQLQMLTNTNEAMAIREREAREMLEQTISEYTEFVQRVTSGDLTVRLSVSAAQLNDQDLQTLGRNLNEMAASLHDMTYQIRETVAAVMSASAQIQTGATQQSASATEQDVTVTETVATVEEVRTTVSETADRALAVTDAAHQSIEVSQAGKTAVDETIEGMRLVQQHVESIAQNILMLSERTQQIGEIIDTVNALADQSKLLALNASIEAARAGEEGKGFAVVAMEVRQLAEQSRDATARVRDILTEIQQATNNAVMVTEQGSKVAENGVRLVERAGITIEQLEQTLNQTSQMTMQIAASTQQQTNGMDQLIAAMQQIKAASSQAAESTLETERSVENLTQMAHVLEDVTSRYQI